MLSGYKTYIGAAIMAISAFMEAVPELQPLAEPFRVFGMALLGVGIGHKLAKATNGQ